MANTLAKEDSSKKLQDSSFADRLIQALDVLQGDIGSSFQSRDFRSETIFQRMLQRMLQRIVASK